MKQYFKLSSLLIVCLFLYASISIADQIDWDVIYQVDTLPHNHINWNINQEGYSELEVHNGLLFMDTTSALKNFLFFERAWNADNKKGCIVEARLKLKDYIGSIGLGGCAIWVGDDLYEDVILISKNQITLYASKISYEFPDSSFVSDFRIYRIETKKDDILVYIDNQLVIDGRGQYGKNFSLPARNHIVFGDGSRGAGCISVWDYIKYSIK